MTVFSIDQNSHSLWDTLPKLQALVAAGREVHHFIEDIDVAFTAIGADLDEAPMELARERFYASGGQDWGAAMFYSDFLGREPLDLRTLEPQLGQKLAALARTMDTTVEALYDEFALSDNWILTGSSYVGDRRHHRCIGDLGRDETEPWLRRLLKLAEQDCLERFPQGDAHQRIRGWFSTEFQIVDGICARAEDSLCDVYAQWLAKYVSSTATIDRSGSLFAPGADPHRDALIELFLRDYDTAAGLYNQALADVDLGLHPLDTAAGELPCFGVFDYQGCLVRSPARLDGRTIRIAEMAFDLDAASHLPVEAMRQAGIEALPGKAVLLVLQARIGPHGGPLALPKHGSTYMPAAHRLANLLAEADLLPAPLRPVLRVDFKLLDRIAELDTLIRLPKILREPFGCDELPACQLSARYGEVIAEARTRLGQLTSDAGRDAWARAAAPDLVDRIDVRQEQKRRLASQNPKDPRVQELWQQIRHDQATLAGELLEQVVRDTHAAHLDFYNSRGAILPWCVALGGEEFYSEVIASAEITQEPADG